jgi:choice-of-anchor C domain-containing protein
MKLKFVSGVVAAGAMALMAGGAFAATNLVLDPNFDNPSGGGTFTTYSGGQTFGAWLVTGASVDLIGGYWQAPVGGGSVDLDGNAPGGVSQNITLSAGTYLLSFYLSGNPDGGDPVKTVDVSLDGTSEVFTYNTALSGNNHTDMDYVLESMRVTVTGGLQTLSFASQDASTSPWGPVIGGVSLTAVVPEPATWALMLTGFAAIGGGLRRRRATVAA